MSEGRSFYEVRQEIVKEMMQNFVPTPQGEVADEELTSLDLVERFADTVDLTADEISVQMHELGFHIRLRGSKFYWQINNI